MNLLQTLEIFAIGGPGSGPNAPCPQCGPKSGGDRRSGHTGIQGPKGKPAPERAHDAPPMISPRGPSIAKRAYEDWTKRQATSSPELKDWTKRFSQSIEHPSRVPTTLREGDKVKTTVPVRAWVATSLRFRNFDAGKVVGIIVSIHPALPGVRPEMAKVKLKDDIVRIATKDLELHKLAGQPLDPTRQQTQPQPVPENRVKMQTTTSDGAKLTIIRPSREVGDRTTNLNSREHPDKGSFENTDKEFGMTGAEGHEGHNLKSWVFESDRGDGSGAVVWLHKYTEASGRVRQTIIREENFQSNRTRYGRPIQFEYNNPAKAFKTLRDRYGISMTMKDWRY